MKRSQLEWSVLAAILAAVTAMPGCGGRGGVGINGPSSGGTDGAAGTVADGGGGGGVAEAGVDAGGPDAPALPADAGLAELLYGRTFTYWALRQWDRVAFPVTLPSDPIPESAYVPMAPEPHYIVRFSADGLSTTLTPVPDGGAPPSSMSGVRKTTSDVSATYEDLGFAGGVFAVTVGSGLPAAKLTIKGSGVPIIYATAGELRD